MIKKWQYIEVAPSRYVDDECVEEFATIEMSKLNKLGAQGWELVSINADHTKAIMKREYARAEQHPDLWEMKHREDREPMPATYIHEGTKPAKPNEEAPGDTKLLWGGRKR